MSKPIGSLSASAKNISNKRVKELTDAQEQRDFFNKRYPGMHGDGPDYDLALYIGAHKDLCWTINPTAAELILLRELDPATWN
jgi:hypothetical protein